MGVSRPLGGGRQSRIWGGEGAQWGCSFTLELLFLLDSEAIIPSRAADFVSLEIVAILGEDGILNAVMRMQLQHLCTCKLCTYLHDWDSVFSNTEDIRHGAYVHTVCWHCAHSLIWTTLY